MRSTTSPQRVYEVAVAFIARLSKSRQTLLLTLAMILGLLVGAAIAVFRASIEGFHEVFAVVLTGGVLAPLFGVGGIVISLALAGLIVGAIMERFIGHERHHGVAGVMEAVALAGGRLRYRRMPFKALASALSLGAGASVGPEDPSVQIGSNVGSWVGQWPRLRLSEDEVRLLVAAGAASAIAAAFKAPIAGVFFAIEVILNSAFETRSFGVIVLAAVIASAFTQAIEPGSEMGPFAYTLGTPLEILLFIPLGVMLALVSALFIRAMAWQQHLWEQRISLPRPLKTALAGALVGVVAIFLPQIMGPGRETMNEVLSGHAEFSLGLLLALGAVKLFMTAVSVGGGFVGGVFAPSLFVGIMLGEAYGRVVNAIFPSVLTSDAQTYAIGGMAAMLAGVVRSPITAILLVFELTNDYRLILPIMLSAVVCMVVVERLESDGIYVRGLKRKGVFLPQGREIDLLQAVRIRDVMRSPAPVIDRGASLSELRDALREQDTRVLCVVDASGGLSGVVTLGDLQHAYSEAADTASTLFVGDICTPGAVIASPDEPLKAVVQRLNSHNLAALPVLSRETGELIGLFDRKSVIRAYALASEKRHQNQVAAQQVRLQHLAAAHVFQFRVNDSAAMANQKIADMDLPPDSVIVTIDRNGKLLPPRGATVIEAGDLVTIVAPEDMGTVLQGLAQGIR